MNNSIDIEQEQREEQELSAFTCAVTQLFGQEQARLSERDWLDESDLIDSPPFSAVRNLRAVTIAALFRLGAHQPRLVDLLSEKRSWLKS